MKQRSGDIAENIFEARWMEITGEKPAKLVPDREGFDYDASIKVSAHPLERSRVRFQVKSHLYKRGLPPRARVKVSLENVRHWNSTADPVYFVVVAGRRELFDADPEQFRREVAIFIYNAKRLTADIDTSEHSSKRKISVLVPLVCPINRVSVAMLSGALNVFTRMKSVVGARFSIHWHKSVERQLYELAHGNYELDLTYRSISPLVGDLDIHDRRAASIIISSADCWSTCLRILSEEAVNLNNTLYVVATDALNDNFPDILFSLAGDRWVQSAAQKISKGVRMRRILVLPAQSMPQYRRYLVMVYIIHNICMGVELAIVSEGKAVVEVDRAAFLDGTIVESSYPTGNPEWETLSYKDLRFTRKIRSILKGFWYAADFYVTSLDDVQRVASHLGLDLSEFGRWGDWNIDTLLDFYKWGEALLPGKSLLVTWPRKVLAL